MLDYNTSMKVAEESFRIEIYVSYGVFAEGLYSDSDLFSFWIILPKGKYNKCKYNALFKYDTFLFLKQFGKGGIRLE